jgi:hypothetical protein
MPTDERQSMTRSTKRNYSQRKLEYNSAQQRSGVFDNKGRPMSAPKGKSMRSAGLKKRLNDHRNNG